MNDQLKADLCDIYDLWHTPFWQTTWFFVVCLMIPTTIVLGVTVYFVIRYMSQKRIVPAWERALHQINTLQPTVYTSKEEGKLFYFELTAILKNYFNERYGLCIKGKTDRECLEISLPEELKPLLHDIFSGCLRIKYADESALQEQLIRDHSHAILLVKQTSPSKEKE